MTVKEFLYKLDVLGYYTCKIFSSNNNLIFEGSAEEFAFGKDPNLYEEIVEISICSKSSNHDFEIITSSSK